MDGIARFVLRHKLIVISLWIIAAAVGGTLTSQTTKRFTLDFSIPGQPGFKVAEQIQEHYGNGEGTGGSSLAVFQAPVGAKITDSIAVPVALRSFGAQFPNVRVTDWWATRDPQLVSADGRTTYALLFQPRQTITDRTSVHLGDALRATPKLSDNTTVGITGYNQLELSQGGTGNGPGILLEVLFGALGALAVLAFVFASWLALLPLVIAAVSIPVIFGIILPLTYLMDVSFVVQFLVALIGLGVAIDYSLLIVTRWREERDHGRTNEEAVRVAVLQAGHAVVFSGGAVALGLLSLTVLPAPFLRSMGIAGMFIPLVSTLATITLTPAILATIGPRIDWPRIRKEGTASRFWLRWAGWVVRRPWVAAGLAIAMLGLLATPFLGIRLGLAGVDSLATSGPAYESLQTIRAAGLPTGVITPMEVLVKGTDTAGVVKAAKGVPGVAAAIAPGSFQKDGYSLVEVIPTHETVNSDNIAVVTRLRDALGGQRDVIGITGAGPIQLDYQRGIYDNFPLVLSVLALLTFLALARAFRSVILAIKAVLLNLVSLIATFGVLSWVWQDGHGSHALFGLPKTGAVVFWVPIMVFAFLYGLSMDYEVFILTRVREEYDSGSSTNEAMIEGLGRTGRLVTSAALILFMAFISLASSPGTEVKILATGLGIGILLDATIIRALLVPALVVLFGRWNWWLPTGLARALRIQPSRARTEELVDVS